MTARVDASSQIAAWRKVCALVSGAALGTTADVLRRAGVMSRLAALAEPEPISRLAKEAGLHEGYAHVALVLLATQGLLARTIPGEDVRGARAALTPAGRAWAKRADAYAATGERMAAARAWRAALLGESDRIDAPIEPLAPPRDALDERLLLHARGPLVASVMGALGRLGSLKRLYHAPLGWVALAELGPPPAALDRALEPLVELGWVAREDDLVALTPEGRGAARWAPLFNYVYGYLGAYERARTLLRGERAADATDSGRDDADRELLLAGKAYVFRTGLRGPVEEALSGILGPGVRSPPRIVLDLNAGDGTVLAAVAERARAWDVPVPRLVALVRNPVAEERCRRTLERAGAAHEIRRMDFSNADDVAAELAAAGHALRDALVIAKTTIHDRRFLGAGGMSLPPARGRPSTAVFVSPDGAWIDGRAMEDDLAAFFARWRRHLGPHGMIAIDTHAVPPEIAARTFEENAVTHVAASHGYSSQYLIECARFREAARRAGLESRFRRDLGTERVEAVTMSLDWFVG